MDTCQGVTAVAMAPTGRVPAPDSGDSQLLSQVVAAGGSPDGLRVMQALAAQCTHDAQPLSPAAWVQPAGHVRTAVNPVEVAESWSAGQHRAVYGVATDLYESIVRPGQVSLPADPLTEPRWSRITEWVDEAVGARVARDEAACKETAPLYTTSGPLPKST